MLLLNKVEQNCTLNGVKEPYKTVKRQHEQSILLHHYTYVYSFSIRREINNARYSP